MRIKILAVVTLCLFAAAAALAQEEIVGAGTPGYVPLFTGYHKVGNSNILQSPSGNVGIGWPTPQYPLQIFTNDLPIALYVQAQASVNDACASCRVDAIFGFAGASSGIVTGVNGQTLSPQGIGVIGNFTSTDSQGGGGGV